MRRLSDLDSLKKKIQIPIEQKIIEVPFKNSIPLELLSVIKKYKKFKPFNKDKYDEIDRISRNLTVSSLKYSYSKTFDIWLLIFPYLRSLLVYCTPIFNFKYIIGSSIRKVVLQNIKSVIFIDCQVKELIIINSTIENIPMVLTNIHSLTIKNMDKLPTFIDNGRNIRVFNSKFNKLSKDSIVKIIKNNTFTSYTFKEQNFTLSYTKTYPGFITQVFCNFFIPELFDTGVEILILKNIIFNTQQKFTAGNLQYLQIENTNMNCTLLCSLLKNSKVCILEIPSLDINYIGILQAVSLIKDTLRHLNITNITLPGDFIDLLRSKTRKCKVYYGDNRYIFIQ